MQNALENWKSLKLGYTSFWRERKSCRLSIPRLEGQMQGTHSKYVASRQSQSMLSSRSPVMWEVLLLGCAPLVIAVTGTEQFKSDQCSWWNLTRTLFHSANLNVHSYMMLVGAMLDWTALQIVPYQNKITKSDKQWRNSLGIQLLNDGPHRCSV